MGFIKLNRNGTMISILPKKIIFSSEPHFHLGGYVNKQNYSIWGWENTDMVLQKLMHQLRVTVWCGLWSVEIIGPYLFENEWAQPLRSLDTHIAPWQPIFLWPLIKALMWTMFGFNRMVQLVTYLMIHSIYCVKRFNGDDICQPRSCDLTPLNYFLWGR